MKAIDLINCATVAIFAFSCAPGNLPATDAAGPLMSIASEHEANATVELLSANWDRHPDCSAAAIIDASGESVLVTAAHCVTHRINQDDRDPDATVVAHIGDQIWFVTRGQFVSPRRSVLTAFDPVLDRATLVPLETSPEPLQRRSLCDRCLLDRFPVHSLSAFAGWARSDGEIVGETYAGPGSHYYLSTMTIQPGWSGSPVFDDNGFVVGIVIQCQGEALEAGERISKNCRPNFSVFTDVP